MPSNPGMPNPGNAPAQVVSEESQRASRNHAPTPARTRDLVFPKIRARPQSIWARASVNKRRGQARAGPTIVL